MNRLLKIATGMLIGGLVTGVSNLFLACQKETSPGISFNTETGVLRDAIEATQEAGIYELRFKNVGEPITVKTDGGISEDSVSTYVYMYFAQDARDFEAKLDKAGVDCTIHITHYPHRHCWVAFTSNLLVEPPTKK
jgi:hypothetical protein